MRWFRFAVLYTALALGAIAAYNYAFTPDPGASRQSTEKKPDDLRQGTMKKLVFHSAPRDVSQVKFVDADGGEHQLADWQGKYVAVNFWATWCAPCRKEMPSLDALQGEFGGDDFEVVTIATGRNTLPAITRFFEEANVTRLPILLDPKLELAREMAVLGLPITIILNPEGQEIARLQGDAEWFSDSAKEIIAALISGS